MLNLIELTMLLVVIGCAANLQNHGIDECQNVEVNELYSNYQYYDNAQVCTSGVLRADVGGVVLLPEDLSLTLQENKLLRVMISYSELLNLGLDDGDEVILGGAFSYNKECFSENDDESNDTICAPIQYPMYFSDVTVSKK